MGRFVAAATAGEVSRRRVARWWKGLAADQEPGTGSFLDLVELRVMTALLAAGFRVRAVRRMRAELQQWSGHAHPFATHRLLHSGDRLYACLDDGLQTLGHGGQTAMETVVEVVADEIDFTDDGVAFRWWPAGRDGGVMLEPDVSSGVPVVAGTRVATRILFDSFLREGEDAARVARMFRLEKEQVAGAVAYERRLREAA